MEVDGNGVMRQMTPKDPGPNGWVANQDPITLIGDLAITDTTVTVRAKLNLVADGQAITTPLPSATSMVYI